MEEKRKEKQKRNIEKEERNKTSKITGEIQERKSYKNNVTKTRRRKKRIRKNEKKNKMQVEKYIKEIKS